MVSYVSFAIFLWFFSCPDAQNMLVFFVLALSFILIILEEYVLSKILAKIDISISKRLTWPWRPAPFSTGAARPEGEGSIELATAGTSNNQQHVTAVGANEKKD